MQEKAIKLFNILFPIFIFALSFFVRFFNIGLLSINYDETRWARFLLANPEFIKRFLGIPLISFPFIPHWLQHFLITHISSSQIFSLNEFMLHMRFQPVVIGAATVLLVYILARQMYGQKTAIISSLLLCFLPWHIIQSRLMLRVIWIPLFGCLIFLGLFKALQEKRRIWAGLWFLLSCFFLKESLKGYESAILFIPIFFVSLIYLNKEINRWIKVKTTLIAILIAFLFIFPIIYTALRFGTTYWEGFCRFFQRSAFDGFLFFDLWENFRNNIGFTFQQLFFTSQASSLLYGQALRTPLLIHPIIFILFLASLAFAIWQRKTADKILLIWLFLAFFGVIMGVDSFQARYILIILPPLLILIGRFIAEVFNKMSFSKSPLIKKGLLITGAVLLLGIINLEIIQWVGYYYSAPFNFAECWHNSYGCKEAAEYLSKLPNIKNYNIITHFRGMTVDVYLNYYLLKKGKIDKYYNFTPDIGLDKSETGQKEKIYVLWAPESHPKHYRDGLFRDDYDSFKQRYLEEIPMKTVYYPNGLAAINIFKGK